MDPTLEELLNGRQTPSALPNVNPQGLTQAGANMSTMGAQPSPVTNPQAQPPATPEEFNARKNGWMQMMQQLRADPSAQQAVMFTAARLLQGQKFGQSVGGALGEAAFGGMSMYNQLQENASEQQLKQREAERRDQFVGSQIDVNTAQAGEVRQRTEESAKKAPLEMKKMEAETAWREAERRVSEAKAKGLEAQDPVQMAKLEVDLAKAKIAAENALVAARNRSNVNEPKKSQFMEQMDFLIEQQKFLNKGISDEEAKAKAIAEYRKSTNVNELVKKATTLSKMREDYVNATLGLDKKAKKPTFRQFAEQTYGKEMVDYVGVPLDTTEPTAKEKGDGIVDIDAWRKQVQGTGTTPVTSGESGISQAEFDVMLKWAKRGSAEHIKKVQQWRDANELTLGQIKQADSVLQKGR